MLTANRSEFDTQMGKLAVGFNAKRTPDLTTAYWEAFASLSIIQFARIVEHALSQEYGMRVDPKYPAIPTVPQLWHIHSTLKARQPAPARAVSPASQDSLALFANRMLLIHLQTRGGLGSADGKPCAELLACLAARAELVREFTDYIAGGDELATPREYLRRWVRALQPIGSITADCLARYRRMAASAEGRAPFPAWMAVA
jgi:hypothetical protein